MTSSAREQGLRRRVEGQWDMDQVQMAYPGRLRPLGAHGRTQRLGGVEVQWDMDQVQTAYPGRLCSLGAHGRTQRLGGAGRGQGAGGRIIATDLNLGCVSV